MSQKPLEVLGIGSLHEHCFLVYFSDKTYATVSASKLAEWFPQRQAIPESVIEDRQTETGLGDSRSLRRVDVQGTQVH